MPKGAGQEGSKTARQMAWHGQSPRWVIALRTLVEEKNQLSCFKTFTQQKRFLNNIGSIWNPSTYHLIPTYSEITGKSRCSVWVSCHTNPFYFGQHHHSTYILLSVLYAILYKVLYALLNNKLSCMQYCQFVLFYIVQHDLIFKWVLYVL